MYLELINHASEQFPFLIEHDDIRYIPHFHHETEIVYVLSGELTCTLGMDNRLMQAGDICVVPPDTVHNLYTEQTSKSFVIKVYPIPGLTNLFLRHPIIKSGEPFHATLQKFLSEIMRENETKGIAYELAVNALLKLFFLLLIRNFDYHELDSKLLHKYTHESRFLDKVNSFLDAHYMESFSLATAAEYFNYTPNYFCRYFKQTIGMTFWEYYTLYRLDKSVQLMAELPSANISTIAVSSGFKNMRSFNESFKRFYRCTPSKYRRFLLHKQA